MFRNLRFYYFFIALPFALLLIGSALFFDSIKLTITRNPHPQINYTIFIIILAGGTLILLNARRLLREARTIVEFSRAIHAKTGLPNLREMAANYTGETSCLLQMVAASGGRSISHQEQVAIENELTNTRAGLLRRNALPQYLTGLLVGMGLLGTFIGLLATLNDISVLINSFADLDMKSASPLLVFRTMIERMKAPMQSMGIAFSASMFGLLGSIILGLMMVGIRRLQGDMFSLLSSEVARHIELALSHESDSFSEDGIDSGDVTKSLIRIESRYAEAARSQQRALKVLIDDIQKHRTEMLRALTAQTEASNSVGGELKELGRQLGDIASLIGKGLDGLSAQTSDLTVHLVGDAKETQRLLVAQLDEQKTLRAALDSYKIEERLVEAARHQQRALSSVISDMGQQRAEMLRALADQTESNNRSSGELQQLGGQLEAISNVIDKGNEEIVAQVSEMTVQMASDAKISHKLLEDVDQRLSDELQQLGTSMSNGNGEICSRVSEVMRQAATVAKESNQLLSDTGQSLRTELQTVGRQLVTAVEKGDDKVCTRVSDLMGQVAVAARESNDLLDHASQKVCSEVQQLGATMGAGNSRIDTQIAGLSNQLAAVANESHEQLGRNSRDLRDELQQLAAVVEKGDAQICSRISETIEHMVVTAKGSHEMFGNVGSNFCNELQQLGSVMERGNDEVCSRISEMMAHMAVAASEGDEVSAEQLDETSRQGESSI